jgi:hypothetical protein
MAARAASFLAALPILLLTFARVLGRKVRSPVDLYFSALQEIAPSPQTVQRDLGREVKMRGGQ